jgi:hypothetical protein
MSTKISVDAARLELMLTDLRLPATSFDVVLRTCIKFCKEPSQATCRLNNRLNSSWSSI